MEDVCSLLEFWEFHFPKGIPYLQCCMVFTRRWSKKNMVRALVLEKNSDFLDVASDGNRVSFRSWFKGFANSCCQSIKL